jgi:hypothetical protein
MMGLIPRPLKQTNAATALGGRVEAKEDWKQ